MQKDKDAGWEAGDAVMGEEIVFFELERYGRDMRREKHASIQGMVDRMEPVFRKAGYRRGGQVRKTSLW